MPVGSTFDIAGNHYRLIAAIHFNTQTLDVRAVLTHAEYDDYLNRLLEAGGARYCATW